MNYSIDPVGSEKVSLEPLSYRSREAAKVLGISLSSLSRLTKRGEIRVARDGNIRLYPREELKRWLRSRLSDLTETE